MDSLEKPTFLPYPFAKKQGVVTAGIGLDGMATIHHLPNTPLQIFAEIKRLLQCELQLREVNPVEFQQQLTQVFTLS